MNMQYVKDLEKQMQKKTKMHEDNWVGLIAIIFIVIALRIMYKPKIKVKRVYKTDKYITILKKELSEI